MCPPKKFDTQRDRFSRRRLMKSGSLILQRALPTKLIKRLRRLAPEPFLALLQKSRKLHEQSIQDPFPLLFWQCSQFAKHFLKHSCPRKNETAWPVPSHIYKNVESPKP